MRLALGTQGWAYADWVGPMYDAGTRQSEFLRAYAREFDTVEVVSTLYGTPRPVVLRRWAAQVPAHFTFSLKLVREITHDRHLVRSEALLDEFVTSARVLGPQLEAILIQMPPDFGPSEIEALEAFVARLPDDVRWTVELRDAAWFEGSTRERVREILASRDVALTITDSVFVPLETMLDELRASPASHAYLRWLGRRDDVAVFSSVTIDRHERVARWAEALRADAPRRRRISGYVNNHYSGHAPATVRDLLAALEIPHERPGRIEQTSLF